MGDRFWLRRRLLAYLGLGTIAAVGATAGSPSGLNVTAATSNAQLPDFQGIAGWLNSPPLTVKQLQGQVTLVQFWTFSCINCQRTLPYIVRWHEQYASLGLKIVGVHTPEFAFERDVNNVKQAIAQWRITYPVPLDNEFKTWNAYRNQYWPNLYLADRRGVLQYQHAGEGAYERTESTIRQLLGKS